HVAPEYSTASLFLLLTIVNAFSRRTRLNSCLDRRFSDDGGSEKRLQKLRSVTSKHKRSRSTGQVANSISASVVARVIGGESWRANSKRPQSASLRYVLAKLCILRAGFSSKWITLKTNSSLRQASAILLWWRGSISS